MSKKNIYLSLQATHFPFDAKGVSLGHLMASFASKNWNWFTWYCWGDIFPWDQLEFTYKFEINPFPEMSEYELSWVAYLEG